MKDLSKNKLEKLLNSPPTKREGNILRYKTKRSNIAKLNRTNVLEELGKGRVWKNVYAHYYRLLYVLRWLKPHQTILDLGCGRAWLRDLCYRNKLPVYYIGVDLSIASLRMALRRKCGYPFILLNCDAASAPIKYETIDTVVCLEIIEHNSKARAKLIMNKAFKLLKTGGTFFVSTPIRKGNVGIFPEDHIYEWQLDELCRYIRKINFKIESIAGCFSISRQLKNILPPEEKQFLDRLEEYFNWHVLSPIFSCLHPKESQGVILRCLK